jgi:hypothetical protein
MEEYSTGPAKPAIDCDAPGPYDPNPIVVD